MFLELLFVGVVKTLAKPLSNNLRKSCRFLKIFFFFFLTHRKLENSGYQHLLLSMYEPVLFGRNRDYVYSVAVYQKYLTRLEELIIFDPWRENYHFSQQSWIFLIYDNTMYVFYLCFNVLFVKFYYF